MMNYLSSKKLGPLLIVIAACFWGSMGIFLVLAAVVVLNWSKNADL